MAQHSLSAQAPEPQTALHVPSDPAVPLSARSLGFSSTQASVLLDVLRALAAILVMLGHWRNLFFVDYADIPIHRSLYALPYVLTSAGHQAVVIFFVLSGYLISGSVFRSFTRNAWSWRNYLLQRGVRLWIVLLPGLLLGALLDLIGLHLHRAPAVALYGGASGDHLVLPVAASFHLSTFFGNLFFLQGIYVPVFGSNGPLWSLANEFWYYLLFPLGLLALLRKTPSTLRILCVVLFVAIAASLPWEILILFLVWLMGTLLAKLDAPRLAAYWRWLATALYVCCLFFFAKNHAINSIVADLIFGVLTFGFLYVLLSARSPAHERSLWTRLWRTLARFSYTLYVVHLPLLVLLAAISLGDLRWAPDLHHVVVASGYLCIAVAYAYALARVTEFRTDRLRKWLERRLPGSNAAS